MCRAENGSSHLCWVDDIRLKKKKSNLKMLVERVVMVMPWFVG